MTNFPVHTIDSAPEADADIDRFIAAGFGKDHALEVIAIVAASTITNYTGSVTKTPLEVPFQEHAWAGRSAGPHS